MTVATFNPSQDAYTDSLNAATVFNNLRLQAGASNRAYMQFDLSSIPAAAVIGVVTLDLAVISGGNAATHNTMFISKITGAAWSETTLTFTNAPADDGADYGNVDMTTWIPTPFIYQIPVSSALIKGWVDGTFSNFGMKVSGTVQEANGSSWKRWDSSTGTTKPLLTVNYTLPTSMPPPPRTRRPDMKHRIRR